MLPWGIGAESKACRTLACSIQFDKVLGYLPDFFACPGFCGSPVGSAQLIEFRDLCTNIFADKVKLVCGDIELVRRRAPLAWGILDNKVFPERLGRLGWPG